MVTKDSKEHLGISLLVIDAFVVLTVHGIISLSFICFPQNSYGTAGKTFVYSSLSFVVVETSKFSMIFVKFAIAALLKLFLLFNSSLV